MEQVAKVIEEAIRHFGVDPDENRVEGQHKWKLSRGSAEIRVRIFTYDGESTGVEVCAYMVTIPENPEVQFNLFKTALTLNDSLVGCWFSIREGTIYLVSNRDANGLDAAELVKSIDELSWYADHYDDRMQADFAD